MIPTLPLLRLLTFAVVTGAAVLPARSSEIAAWSVLELEFTAATALATPYVDSLVEGKPALMTARFRGLAGDAAGRELVVPGFWDGGRTWRVRFAPPAAGEWSYLTTSADVGLNGHSGGLRVRPRTEAEKQANPTHRGFLRIASTGPRAGRHFEYADGTPMLWIGDTWWNWAKRGIRLESFTKLVDDRAAKGFTLGQFFLPGEGWGKDASLLDPTYTEVDLEHLRELERRIAYANSRGLTVWIHPWWPHNGQRSAKERIGAENLRRWCRYVVHRLGAYHVLWVISGEYNKGDYGGFDLEFWKGVGRLFDAEDPYNHPISGHPTPPTYRAGWDAPQWSTGDLMHNEPWLDYNQSQTGHGRWTDELIPWIVATNYARRPAKPIVVTEPSYEFVEGDPPAHVLRFAAWSAILSGAAGHSYGGGHVWRAHLPESPAAVGAWPMDTSFETDTLNYPGARSIGFMSRFLRTTGWWRLEPHPELITEYPMPYCAAEPGVEYLALLRFGGIAKLDLRAASASDTFEVRWVDLEEEKIHPSATVAGGAVQAFHSPERPRLSKFKDWVLHVRKK